MNNTLQSQKYFNKVSGVEHAAWAASAAAYFRKMSGGDKRNFVEAMADYYSKLNRGEIVGELEKPTSNLQTIASNGDTVQVYTSALNTAVTGTLVVQNGVLTRTMLGENAATVLNNQTHSILSVTGTFTSKVKFIVSGGRITDIVLS